MAQQQPTQQRKIAGMNMIISNAHQVTTQLVGLLVSCANILAICLSVISVISGFVLFAVLSFPAAWGLWIVAGVMGVMLSILIEGLTIGSLARMRLMGQKIKEIERTIEKERDGIDWAKLPGKKHWWSFGSDERAIQERLLSEKLERQTRDFRRVRNPARVMATFGCTASALVGGLVYHAMLIDLGLMSLVIGAVAPLVITITFVASESYKDSQEEVMREGFSGGGLRAAAIKEETDRRLMNAMVDMLFDDRLDDPQTLDVLKARVLQVKLAALDRIQVTTVSEVSQTLLPQQVESDKVTMAPAPEQSGTAQGDTGTPDQSQGDIGTPATFLGDIVREVFTPVSSESDTDHAAKLTATLAFLDSYPHVGNAWTDEDDKVLAVYLGLDRVGAARYWRLKALETWQPKQAEESASTGMAEEGSTEGQREASVLGQVAQNIGQGNRQRTVEYAAAHPGATQQDIADTLNLSVRTVKRHLAGDRGQEKGQGTGVAPQRLKIVQ